MCLVNFSILIFCFLIFDVHALTCKSDSGPKESDLKNIYTKCLKMQDGKNSSRDSGYEWKENRRSQRNDWEGSGRNKDRKSDRRGTNDRMSYDRMGSHDGMGSYDDRMNSHNERSGDGMGFGDRSDNYGMGNRDNQMADDRIGSGGRDNSMSNRYGRDGMNMNGGNNYQQDFGTDLSDQYGSQSTQSSRRYKRERKTENSGKRSQFNPNSRRSQDSNHNNDNSSENNTSKDENKKACALHCFLENLEMTAEDGMPDRYLVTHTLTKDVTNEDLKDFLQESIEECFKILDNESTEDKCEFSKNLLMCLSEKGRENCDDWKDDLKF